ncbi:MAG: VWA domain-containing protein, partial [Elusimicrobia bacterium]|nr:VWA domain-containing protein [Elusimicrobiota bacterium]
IIAIIFLWVAAIGPQLGTRLVEIHRRGIDVLIAVDCSKSMLAEDIKPNRLARAKLALSSLIQSLEGDRVGIIAFAGTAFLQCPLTLDYSAAKMFLDFIDTDLIPRPGTALGEAIGLSIKSFSRKERKYKVLVLITDGEDHQSEPLAMAQEARREGIKILTVGIGSPSGEPIPVRDAGGAVAGYKKDANGEIVMTRLDETTLQKIALETGGKYFRATSGEIEIQGIMEEIKRMETKDLQSRLLNQYENRYQFFLFVSVMLLMAAWILPETGRIIPGAKFMFVCVLIFSVLPAHASVRGKVNKANSLYSNQKYDQALDVYQDALIDEPESPILHFNQGNAYYRSGEFEKAYESYSKALDAKDIGMQAEAYYNMGNALYRMGKLPEAILHYRKTLELNEDDEDARYNIEFIQKKLKEMADKNKQQSPEQQQQQQKQHMQQQNEENQQDQKQKSEQEQNQQQQQQQQQQSEQKEKEDSAEQEQKKPKKGEMSTEDAERLLNSLEDQEQEAQKKRRRGQAQTSGVAQDW